MVVFEVGDDGVGAVCEDCPVFEGHYVVFEVSTGS